MTPHNFEEILNDIAGKEIADDMNLWPNIQARLETIPAPRPRPLLGLSRAIATLALILFAGTVYAVYQTVSRNGDPGIQAVEELITEIGQTQEWAPEDVKVTLDWGYADGHRIAIGWTIDYPFNLDMAPAVVTLLDRNGTAFEDAAILYGGGGGGGGGGDRIIMKLTQSFDASGITGSPKTLPLTIHFTFNPPNPASQGGGFGGGGGGGGDNSTGMPERRTLTESFRLMFDFELPFIPAEPVASEFTSEANGVTLTVRDLSYAPSATLGKLCYEIPEDREIYWPVVTQKAGEGAPYVTFSGDPENVFAPSEIFCVDLAILTPADPETGVITFTVDWLQTYEQNITPETVAELQARVQGAGLGYDITYVPPEVNGGEAGMRAGWRLGRDSTVDSADHYNQLTRLSAETLHGLIDGPWTFEIDVK